MNQLPWEVEPNRVELEINGYPALIIRHEEIKHLCGYIAVTEKHPFFGLDYAFVNLSVHGGLTYAGEGMPEYDRGLLYYKPSHNEKGEKLHWFGFDCAHAHDYTPGMYMTMLDSVTKQMMIGASGNYHVALERAKLSPTVQMFEQKDYETYKTVEYVEDHLQSLANQFDLQKDAKIITPLEIEAPEEEEF